MRSIGAFLTGSRSKNKALDLHRLELKERRRRLSPAPRCTSARKGRAYPRPTSRLTGKPLRLTAPGLGLCPMTRPRSDRLVRTRRTRPTEQLALRIRCLAWPSLQPDHPRHAAASRRWRRRRRRRRWRWRRRRRWRWRWRRWRRWRWRRWRRWWRRRWRRWRRWRWRGGGGGGGGGGAVVVIVSDQLVMLPMSSPASSTRYRLQVPLGAPPSKVDRLTLPDGAGAGAGNGSAPS